MADDEFTKTFSSVQEEIDYWKSLCKKYKESAESSKCELEEFQASSHELEAELEMQLEAAENRNKELVAANARLTRDIEELRDKLEKQHVANHRTISELETKLAKAEAFGEAMQKYVREIEQANDDLERAKRTAVVSLEDFEIRLNQAIERNAFLENELDEKENLVVCVQRLKDEARDLKHELAVRHQKQPGVAGSEPGSPEKLEFSKDATEKAELISGSKSDEVQVLPTTPSRISATAHDFQTPLTPITPAARISALNIVGDLLRKLGALESKLASCPPIDHSQFSSFNESTSPTQSTPNYKRPSHTTGNAVTSSAPSSVQKGYVQMTV